MPGRSASQRRVLPSMSVKRKVTVPVGSRVGADRGPISGGVRSSTSSTGQGDGRGVGDRARQDAKLREILPAIYPPREQTIVRSEVLHAIIAHRSDGRPLTVEAGVVRIADALDMAKGRSRIPFSSGSLSIHSVSAAAVESVSIERGDVKPIVHAEYPLERAADAHRELEAGRVIGKLILRP